MRFTEKKRMTVDCQFNILIFIPKSLDFFMKVKKVKPFKKAKRKLWSGSFSKFLRHQMPISKFLSDAFQENPRQGEYALLSSSQF